MSVSRPSLLQSVALLVLAASAATAPSAGAQVAAPSLRLVSETPILIAAPGDVEAVVPPAIPASKRGAASSASIVVAFDDAMPEPAREAFREAARLWETHLASPVPIHVSVAWDTLGATTLGSAGPRTVSANFPGAPRADTWYPIALVEALLGASVPGSDPDVVARFNAALDLDGDGALDWDFGTDPSVSTPSGTYHFLTVALHELGHGLGFFGTCGVDAGSGDGYWGLRAASGTDLPVVYDRFTRDASDAGVLDTLRYPNPSASLGALLRSGGVFFAGAAAGQEAGGTVHLYAPASFEPGSSYSHLDEATFAPGTANALMSPKLHAREQIYDPGPVTCGLMGDLGWPLGVACQRTALPVVLLGFDARFDAGTLRLRWETASEALTEGFEVQMRRAEGAWETLAFVAARGAERQGAAYAHELAALVPGRYAFRLRQLDRDGGVAFSAEVAVHVPLDAPYRLTAPAPQPFAERTTLTLTVAEAQRVRVALVDVLGRQVAVLFDGPMAAETPQEVAVTGAGLATGTYFVVAAGERFRGVRQVVRVR